MVVNLSEIIEMKLPELKKADLLQANDKMDDIDSILAGNVSEKWLEKFVNVLSE